MKESKENQTIFVLKGLPASGKSSLAQKWMQDEPGKYVCVSKDDIRKTLYKTSKWHPKTEKLTIAVEDAMVKEIILKTDQSVIIDDTNLNPKHIERWKAIAKECKCDIEFIEMETSLADCIERDSRRPNPVGKDNILNMAYMFNYDVDTNEFVICDLDGTLANATQRFSLATNENDEIDWAIALNPDLVKTDLPRKETFDLLKADIAEGYDIVICSGRSDVTRKATEEWLRYYGGQYINNPNFYSRLIMRHEHDRRPDEVLKKYFAEKYMDIGLCAKVYDDRPKVVRMWREEFDLEVIDMGDGREF